MKSLRKSILTLLALTLFGGAGAWAQGPTQVTQFTTGMIASWENDNSDVTLADLQALGFGAVDASVAQAWTGAPQGDFAVLIYGFDGTYFNYIIFDNGTANPPSYTGYSKSGLYDEVAYGTKLFYTSSPVIELTKSGDNQWTLAETPDYDLELQVEYYQKYALKNIPEGWTVKVDGVDKTAAIDHDSLKITETAQVLLTPDHPERVKKVILVDEGPAVQTLIVAKGSTELSGNKELYYMPGDTYRQALARPENQSGNDLGWGLWDGGALTTIYFKEVSNKAWDMAIDGDYNFAPDMGSCAITLDSVIDPNNHTFVFVDAQ